MSVGEGMRAPSNSKKPARISSERRQPLCRPTASSARKVVSNPSKVAGTCKRIAKPSNVK